MTELPRSGVPWSYPGVPTCDVDDKVETCEVCNDLKGAVEANLGPDAWQIPKNPTQDSQCRLTWKLQTVFRFLLWAKWLWMANPHLWVHCHPCSWCLCGLTGELCSHMFDKLGRWCFRHLLAKCCGFYGTISFLVQPTKKSLERAVFTTHEHTIVFEGNVLPARNTVCPWPGKYESAWDSLAEGSQHFGLHDPIFR